MTGRLAVRLRRLADAGRILIGASVILRPALASAQDDMAGWRALVTTPYGALVPGVTPTMVGTAEEAAAFGGDLEFRYGRLDGETVALNSMGIGARVGNLGLVGVWQVCNGCGQRSLAAVEYDVVLSRVRRDESRRAPSFYAGLRPGLGLGIVSGEGNAAFAIATTIDLPLSVAVPLGSRLWLIPHIAPGVGKGIAIQGGDFDTRFHGAIAAGVSLMEIRPGVGINVGYRRILFDGRPGAWGAGITLRRDMEEPLFERLERGAAGEGRSR